MSKQSELDEILIELINRIELCVDVPGAVSIGREREYAAYTEAKLAILDWHQQEIARAKGQERNNIIEYVQVNQKGQFEEDGTGTVCWYLDDLVEALKELEVEL